MKGRAERSHPALPGRWARWRRGVRTPWSQWRGPRRTCTEFPVLYRRRECSRSARSRVSLAATSCRNHKSHQMGRGVAGRGAAERRRRVELRPPPGRRGRGRVPGRSVRSRYGAPGPNFGELLRPARRNSPRFAGLQGPKPIEADVPLGRDAAEPLTGALAVDLADGRDLGGRQRLAGPAAGPGASYPVKLTSAVSTVPAVRPGAVCAPQYMFVCEITCSGGGAPQVVRSSVVCASETRVAS